MKKFIYTLLIIHCSLLIVEAQVSQEWVRRYLDPPGNYNTSGSGICISKNGDIYVGGQTTLSIPNKFVVIKYNSGGVLQWVGKYVAVNNGNVGFVGMAIDSSENVYITGNTAVNMGPFDIITVKFSYLTGDTIWTRRYTAPNNLESGPRGISTDRCGNIYVVGGISDGNTLIIKYTSQGDTIWTRKNYFNVSLLTACTVDDSCNLYATGYCDAPLPVGSHSLTLKYSPDGVLKWFRSYTDSSSTNICIAVDSLGNCYSGGVIRHYGGGNFVLFKYDGAGNFKWLSRYVMPIYRDAQPNKVSVNKAGTYAVAAGLGGFVSYDYLTIGFNALTGDTLWTKTYDGPGLDYDEINAMTMDKYSNVYVTGRSVGSGSGFDYATLKYSMTGQQEWVIRYNYANGTDIATSIALDTNFNVYVTGGSWNGTVSEIATVKYSQPMGIKPVSRIISQEFILFQNYPNPFNPTTKITYQIPTRSYVRLMVYDLLGREIAALVNENKNPGVYQIEFDGTYYPSGVYFYRLSSYDKIIDAKKLILIK